MKTTEPNDPIWTVPMLGTHKSLHPDSPGFLADFRFWESRLPPGERVSL